MNYGIPPDYNIYKFDRVESAKRNILNALKDIGQTSLKSEDKRLLLAEIKEIVASF